MLGGAAGLIIYLKYERLSLIVGVAMISNFIVAVKRLSFLLC
jgi:hypothetical protein